MELKYLRLQNFLSFKDMQHTFLNEPVLRTLLRRKAKKPTVQERVQWKRGLHLQFSPLLCANKP